jgi:hypothetical protein
LTMIVNTDSVRRVRRMIETSAHRAETIAEVKKMLSVKQRMMTYDDYNPCCGINRREAVVSLEEEVTLLETVIATLEHDETERAIDLLEEYEQIVGEKYR